MERSRPRPRIPCLPGLTFTGRDLIRPAAVQAASMSQQRALPQRRPRGNRRELRLGRVAIPISMRRDARDDFRLFDARDHAQPAPAAGGRRYGIVVPAWR